MKTLEQEYIEQLEAIGSKSVSLLEQSAKAAAPRFLNILKAINSWLTTKLVHQS